MSERRLVGSRLQALLGMVDQLRPPGALDFLSADEILGNDEPPSPVYIDIEETEPSAQAIVLDVPPDEARRRMMQHVLDSQRGASVGVITLPCLLSPAAAAMKEMLDAELAEQNAHPCPRCGGPTFVGYPGGDPEDGPAERRCRNDACQHDHEMEEMETVFVVTHPNECTGVSDGVDVQVLGSLEQAAEAVSEIIGVDVDFTILTGDVLFKKRGDSGWSITSADELGRDGWTSEWVQISKRRIR